jgi:hypothetical protein
MRFYRVKSSSSVLDAKFASHLSSLYTQSAYGLLRTWDPFCIPFLRLTKETACGGGAGYTSPWLLQALKDTDDEMERIPGATAV